MRCGNPIHQSGSLRQLLFFTSTIVLGILIVAAHWGGKELSWFLDWFPIPGNLIRVSQFGSMIGLFILVIFVGWAFSLVHVLVVPPRPITAMMFLATAVVGVGIAIGSDCVTTLYRREQPVVGLMLLFAIAVVAEVYIRKLSNRHFVTALAGLLVAIAFWFTVILLVGAA
jgi:hypothetical protein